MKKTLENNINLDGAKEQLEDINRLMKQYFIISLLLSIILVTLAYKYYIIEIILIYFMIFVLILGTIFVIYLNIRFRKELKK